MKSIERYQPIPIKYPFTTGVVDRLAFIETVANATDFWLGLVNEYGWAGLEQFKYELITDVFGASHLTNDYKKHHKEVTSDISYLLGIMLASGEDINKVYTAEMIVHSEKVILDDIYAGYNLSLRGAFHHGIKMGIEDYLSLPPAAHFLALYGGRAYHDIHKLAKEHEGSAIGIYKNIMSDLSGGEIENFHAKIYRQTKGSQSASPLKYNNYIRAFTPYYSLLVEKKASERFACMSDHPLCQMEISERIYDFGHNDKALSSEDEANLLLTILEDYRFKEFHGAFSSALKGQFILVCADGGSKRIDEFRKFLNSLHKSSFALVEWLDIALSDPDNQKSESRDIEIKSMDAESSLQFFISSMMNCANGVFASSKSYDLTNHAEKFIIDSVIRLHSNEVLERAAKDMFVGIELDKCMACFSEILGDDSFIRDIRHQGVLRKKLTSELGM